MNKKLIIVSGILVIALGLFLFILGPSPAASPAVTGGKGFSNIDIKPELLNISLPLSNSPRDAAWAVFQKYIGYNKTRDLEGVRSVVYKVAPVCEDPKLRIDCEARMGLAYAYGKDLKKNDFVNVWSDQKQTILSTDFNTREDDNVIVRTRAIIFFIRDESGNLKMLSFSPLKGASTEKSTASKEELDYRIMRYTEDKDIDGVADYEEECLAVKEWETCVKTDPKIRDTDGNGWWDGVQALMR